MNKPFGFTPFLEKKQWRTCSPFEFSLKWFGHSTASGLNFIFMVIRKYKRGKHLFALNQFHLLSCSHDGHPFLDTYAIVSGHTVLGDLVASVLSALGLPQLVEHSRGLFFFLFFFFSFFSLLSFYIFA